MQLHRRFVAGVQRSGGCLCRNSYAGWRSSIVAFAAFAAVATAVEPYIPTDDNEVLETLPRSLLSSRDELTTLRRQLAEDPNDTGLASKVAERYLQMGNLEGDPRFYGYSRAAIHPWWESTSPPPAILKLRAKLKEKDHLYDQALADLDQLLEQHPRDVQAWIELANIYRVQGKYSQARQACDTLSEFASLVPTTLCRAPLQAATGQAEEAYASLGQVLPSAKTRWPSTVQWMLTMQAQIAQALGREQQAEQHLLEGLANNPGDRYLMRAYADFLLDHGREKQTLSLLREHTSDNGILLRAAIAARRSGNKALAAEWQTQLESRFEEIRLRGNQPHGRFEARYALELKNDAQRALTVALANWQKQKETRDTRNVLEAAIAADDPVAAQPVLAFLAENGTEEVVLRSLAQQLKHN